MKNIKWCYSLAAGNILRNAAWDPEKKVTPSFRGNELAGEVGEACNIIKKLERKRIGIRGSEAKIQDLAEELADIVICTDLIAMEYGIDLKNEVKKKFNSTSEKYKLPIKINSV